MNWRRILARTISECTAVARGVLGRRPGFRVLLYHAVGSRLAADSYGFSIHPDLFERHMRVLAESEGLSLVGFREGQAAPARLRVAVTFDDGYKDNLQTAAPVLLKYGIPFTVFVTSSFIRKQEPPYLTPTELRELAALPGVTIGSHGATHVPLAKCDDPTLWHELDDSRQYLEDVLGKAVTAIAYPYGSVDLRVAAAARRAGYEVGGCSRLDINDDDREPLLLCRSEVIATDSERVFLQKLYGAWDWCRWRARDPARRTGTSRDAKPDPEHPDSIYPLW